MSPLTELTKLQELDFIGTSVSDLTPLAGLTDLRILICWQTAVSDLSPLIRCQRLQTLILGITSVSDLSPLRELHQLQRLDFGSTFVTNLSPLAGLHKLQVLEFSFTKVSDLSPLSSLHELTFLQCRGTLVFDLSPLAKLTSLDVLDCRETSIRDLTPLRNLHKLTMLFCGSPCLSDLSPLARLHNLVHLCCTRSPISNLSPLRRLNQLLALHCPHTLVNDLSPLEELPKLRSLDCSDTQVNDLTPLAKLRSLKRLDASHCRISVFPHELLRDESQIELFLCETQIPGIPPETLSTTTTEDCRQKLLDHLKDLEAGGEPVSDVKVIVIGNGLVGKTQICRRLRGEEFDVNVSSTHGISVTRAELKMPEDELIAQLNLWDFGGQDLYHGTHALFLKSRAVFLVVWTQDAETRREFTCDGGRFRNQPLDYWIESVRQAAGRSCSLILVQNQCDEPANEASLPVDSELLRHFPYVQRVHYSAKRNRKRDSLNDALREGVRHLRNQEGIAKIGRGRMRVVQTLQQWIDEDSQRDPACRLRRTLTRQQFQELCDDAGGISSPESLLDYLHHAGVVFYRKGLFNDEIVLDQNWALDAIYTVFDRQQCYTHLRQLGGRFTRSLLAALVWQSHPVEDQQLFLSLMESCGICFRHRQEDQSRKFEAEYVAPDLLPERHDVSGQLAGRWDDLGQVIENAWHFEFLHPALAREIISHIGRKAGECAVYWKYGVWFYDASTRASATITQEMQDDRRGRIVLQAQGDQSRALLEAVEELIGAIIRQSGGSAISVEDRPPRDLHDAGLHRPPRHSIPEAFGKYTLNRIHVTDLPRPIGMQRMCVSYAWEDEESHRPDRARRVEDFCSKLAAAGIDVVRDKTHLRFGDELSAFMRQIGSGDLVYVFLSDAYLRSPSCMYELLTIWRTSCDDWKKFRRRTCVYFMPGTDVFSIPSRLKYAGYWKQQRDQIHERINEYGVDVLGETDLGHFKKIQDFANHVDQMLAEIADILRPREFDDFIEHAIDEALTDRLGVVSE